MITNKKQNLTKPIVSRESHLFFFLLICMYLHLLETKKRKKVKEKKSALTHTNWRMGLADILPICDVCQNLVRLHHDTTPVPKNARSN